MTTIVIITTILLLPLPVFPRTFCLVTSPLDQLVYVTDDVSRSLIGQSKSRCAAECGFVDPDVPGCRCFNYNSTSLNCSIYTFEPTGYSFDETGSTVVYQVTVRRIAQGVQGRRSGARGLGPRRGTLQFPSSHFPPTTLLPR